jgi:tRNA U55 pseudouridine synthase TruB
MHFHEDIERKKVEKAIKESFLGKIKQLPPLKSRVKRQEREREIKKFEILEQEGRDFLFVVRCEAGTYIRKLVHDLGEKIGVNAHMAELRRTHASLFDEKDSVNLYKFAEAVAEYKKGNPEKLNSMLIPIEIITKVMPRVNIKEEFIEKVLHGSPIFSEMVGSNETFNKKDCFALMRGEKLVGVAEAEVSSTDIKKSNLIAKSRTIFN